MRKILFASILALISISGYSQSADKGLFKINGGIGGGVLKTYANYAVNGSSVAFPNFGNLGIEYNTRDRLSVGIDLFSHKYATKDTTVISIGGIGGGIDLKYFFMNKEKSNAFIGTSLGGILINFNAYDYPDSNAVDSTRKEVFLAANGIYNKVYIGYNKYFGNTIGLYVKAGVLNAPFRLSYITYDNVEIDRAYNKPASEWKTLFRGGFIEVGLTIKLGGEKNKSPKVDSSDKKKNEPKE